eukprot:TRINITY_DN25468_c0_g1_i1.p1 TRINITY_DN25468_c0_g1~~TRINITY_DN25468_c0_g1_i1.p1  ORF type:complete len:689 (+),score=113.77 TRINITY_DN25468_c0_g1_i1:61-2127(+)
MSAMKRTAATIDDTALYVGDLPVSWTSEDIEHLHRRLDVGDGLDDIKILPRNLPGETGCAILRYVDSANAAYALQALNGYQVETVSGSQRVLRVKHATVPGTSKVARTSEKPSSESGDGWGYSNGNAGAIGGGCWNSGGGGVWVVGGGSGCGGGFKGSGCGWGDTIGRKTGGGGGCSTGFGGSPGRCSGGGAGSGYGTAQAQFSVYVTDIPSSFNDQSLQKFHTSLNLSGLASVKFLPKKLSSETCAAILRYTTQASAQQALTRLSGHPVTTASGSVRYLTAKYPDPPKNKEASATGPSLAPSRNVSPSSHVCGDSWMSQMRRSPAQAEPPYSANGIDPLALYLANVPVGFDQTDVERLHIDNGLDAPSVIKFLPQKIDSESCCAIVHYEDAGAARSALKVLHGFTTETDSGKSRQLTARHAAGKRGGQEDLLDASFGGARGSGSSRAPIGSAAISSHVSHMSHSEAIKGGGKSGASSVDHHAELPSVYVSDLPGDIAEADIRSLIQEVGHDEGLLVGVKFLPRKIQASSICALLRYDSLEHVTDVAAALHRHVVTMPDGSSRTISARVADPPKNRDISVVGGKAFAKGAFGVAPQNRDLYVSEVPVDWDEDVISNLHSEVGLDVKTLANVKILTRRRPDYPTGACILRYVDRASAEAAMHILDGSPVSIPGGERHLAVRFADPPKNG